jgi:hypothetical protein
MLALNDFKQIRTIVREEVGNEVQSMKEDLSSDIIMSNLRMREQMDQLKNRIKNLEIRIGRINHEEVEEDDFL